MPSEGEKFPRGSALSGGTQGLWAHRLKGVGKGCLAMQGDRTCASSRQGRGGVQVPPGAGTAHAKSGEGAQHPCASWTGAKPLPRRSAHLHRCGPSPPKDSLVSTLFRPAGGAWAPAPVGGGGGAAGRAPTDLLSQQFCWGPACRPLHQTNPQSQRSRPEPAPRGARLPALCPLTAADPLSARGVSQDLQRAPETTDSTESYTHGVFATRPDL